MSPGFTLIELMIVIAIMGTLASIAFPAYSNHIERAKKTRCIKELQMIERELIDFLLETDTYPNSLERIGLESMLDPWGNPYEYLTIAEAKTGQLRKDHFLVPVNTDFDLYSKGPDGLSKAPFTAKQSRDDIVRANNGQFFGSVSAY